MKGDFCQLLRADIEMISDTIDDDYIQSKSKHAFKTEKQAEDQRCCLKIAEEKNKKSQMKNIEYDKLEAQEYMVNLTFKNDEVNMLHALRSRSRCWTAQS